MDEKKLTDKFWGAQVLGFLLGSVLSPLVRISDKDSPGGWLWTVLYLAVWGAFLGAARWMARSVARDMLKRDAG